MTLNNNGSIGGKCKCTMVLPKRIRLVAAKVETTIGTDASLAAADAAFNAYDVIIQPTINTETREAQGSFGYLSDVPGARMGTATFKTDIAYDGTTVPTWASVLLPGCGWVNSSGTFTPRSEAPGSNVKTLTIGCYMAGKLKKIVGAVGSYRIVLPTGRMAYIEWTFQGVWVAPSDASILSPTYPTASPIRFASGTCSYNSDDLKVENVTIDSGNQITMREDPTTAAGYCAGIIVDRHPTISANPESDLVATRDTYGDWIAGTEAAFSIVLDGPSDSDITISAPKAQIVNAQESDRNRIVTDSIQWNCQKNGASADQELSIVFNQAT